MFLQKIDFLKNHVHYKNFSAISFLSEEKLKVNCISLYKSPIMWTIIVNMESFGIPYGMCMCMFSSRNVKQVLSRMCVCFCQNIAITFLSISLVQCEYGLIAAVIYQSDMFVWDIYATKYMPNEEREKYWYFCLCRKAGIAFSCFC